jgi:hypothetical protein
MSEQLSLDAYRSTDPETSRMAAAKAARHAATDRDRAFCILVEDGPCTDYELAAGFERRGWPIAPGNTSAGKRRGELRDAGLVAPLLDAEGKPVRRLTPNGASARVWKAVW